MKRSPRNSRNRPRRLGRFATIGALVLGSGLAAGWLAGTADAKAADSGQEEVAPNLTPKAAEAVKKAREYKGAAHGVAGVKAAKDRRTGRLRQPEPGELPPSRSTGRVTEVVVQPDGSVRAYLGDEFLNDTVAVKTEDGRIAVRCAPDAESSLEHAAHLEVK